MADKEPLNLLHPLAMGPIQLTNRVVMAPMTRARAGKDRIPNSMMARYYAQRAGAGMIITEATVVSKQGIGWPQTPGIYNKDQQVGWSDVVEAVHGTGTPIFLQLWHCGRASHSSFHGGDPPVAPSEVKIEGAEAYTEDGKQPYEKPRALETDEIPAIVEDYRKAAERAKAAGFDGVEIHGANGYLIDQFLQSKTNQRDDRYGGSVENRFRLMREVVEAVGSVWDMDRVGVRISPNGAFNDMGSPDYKETFTYVAQQLNELKIGYLHAIDGLGFGFHDLGAPMTLEDFRGLYDGRLMGNCGYDRDSADSQIANGHADFIAFGRPYISNPDLVERFRNGWPLEDEADQSVWYSHDEEGYIDFPSYRDMRHIESDQPDQAAKLP